MNGYRANPKPTRQRRAVTLAEVLIAMGILTVGLLGVAAIFPVGGHYMQSGDVADRGNAIAQAALDDAIIRGHLDPDSWVVHDINNLGGLDAATATARPGAGLFVTLQDGDTGNIATRREGLRQAYAQTAVVDQINAPSQNMTAESFRSTFFGDAFVIDPIGLTGALSDRNSNFTTDVANLSGSFATRSFPGFVAPFEFGSQRWEPWHLLGAYWPVRRVTTVHDPARLNNGASYRLQEPLARELFSAADDLAQHFPTAGDEPVRQRWESWTPGGGDHFASARQSQGDYSWIISVAPSSAAARDAMAIRPDAYPYEVSVVVFHKRTAARGLQATAEAERLVTARVATAGPSGGELLLNRRASVTDGGVDPDPSPFEDLRPGQYVMVVGPHPLSTEDRPILAVRWCRVLNIEDRGEPTLPGGQPILDGDQQVLVALRGADWPWQAAQNLELGSSRITRASPPLGTELSNDLRVAILPGAVAVHTKTMRLEAGSEWSID